MLLGPNKKKMISVIVAGMKKPPFVQKLGEDSGSNELPAPVASPEKDDSYGLDASMEAFISALGSKDTKQAVSAMKNFFSMVDEPEGEAEESAEGE